MSVVRNARNVALDDLVTLLKDQQSRKVDMVVPARSISATDGGKIVVEGAEPILTMEGVTAGDGWYTPTKVFQDGLAQKLGVPVSYLNKTWADRPDIWAANINGWLHGDPTGEVYDPDGRNFLLRAFTGTEETPGLARSLASDSFKIIDHLDIVGSVFQALNSLGVTPQIAGCDLTDRFMRIRIVAPEVVAYAPELLKRYRSPFTGQSGLDNPLVFAGLEIANSETGCGAYTIQPRLEVQVCKNGLKVTKDAFRAVHLGSKMEEGEIRWSERTQDATLELIKSKTVDAVTTFLDVDYMQRVIAGLEDAAAKPVEDAVKTVQRVGKSLQFTEDQIDGILDHFIKGADLTAGGVLHAVTSFAQTVPDGDVAANLEGQALRALEVAAA